MIYDFYDKPATIFDANLDLNPDNICNYDESEFAADPGKSKVLAPRNKPGFKLFCGGCRENITTLAVCNAPGKVLDLLTIFEGKNFQSYWHGDMALPNTSYEITVNGWKSILANQQTLSDNIHFSH